MNKVLVTANNCLADEMDPKPVNPCAVIIQESQPTQTCTLLFCSTSFSEHGMLSLQFTAAHIFPDNFCPNTVTVNVHM